MKCSRILLGCVLVLAMVGAVPAVFLASIVAESGKVPSDGDGIFPRPYQDELMGRIAGARRVVYPGTGDAPRWEQPERFRADMVAFLEPWRRTTESRGTQADGSHGKKAEADGVAERLARAWRQADSPAAGPVGSRAPVGGS